MRLIDADALIEDLKTQFRETRKLLKDPENTELQRYMMRVRMGRLVSTVVDINTAPTVDAVQVTRCKDCVYYRQYADGRYDCDNLYGIADAHKGCFCSRAERRKDNG